MYKKSALLLGVLLCVSYAQVQCRPEAPQPDEGTEQINWEELKNNVMGKMDSFGKSMQDSFNHLKNKANEIAEHCKEPTSEQCKTYWKNEGDKIAKIAKESYDKFENDLKQASDNLKKKIPAEDKQRIEEMMQKMNEKLKQAQEEAKKFKDSVKDTDAYKKLQDVEKEMKEMAEKFLDQIKHLGDKN